MPLTITEEMIKQDPFFEMGLERGKELGLKEGKELGLKEGKELGLKEGERRTKKVLIGKLLKKGMDLEEISALLDISVKEIEDLLKGE